MNSEPTEPAVVREIQRRIDQIVAENDIRILLAIESGSRAWGFWSKDSDYDVRFIYQRRRAKYLSLGVERARDVIETPIEGVFDVNGWDLRKTLLLLRKSNPVLFEWFDSPIVYRSEPRVVETLRRLGRETFIPNAAFHHYARMAWKTIEKHLDDASVKPKKYFYALRPLLAVRWIEAGLGPVPILFRTLLDRFIPSGELREVIDDLLRRKMSGDEADTIPHILPIRDFLRAELARIESVRLAPCPVASLEIYDRVFLSLVDEYI